MKSRIILFMAIAMVAYSCSTENLDTPDGILNSTTVLRSVDQIFETYSALNSDDNFIVKKYEKSLNGLNPSTTISLKGQTFKTYSYQGKSQKVEAGYSNTYISPTDFAEVYQVNSIVVDGTSHSFSEISPIELSDQGSTITSNQLIEWDLPENGTTSLEDIVLIIRADYSEIDDDSESYKAKVILTEDDGSYVVSGSDLSGFPQETPLVVTAVRGDYSKTGKGPLVGTVSIFHTGTLNKI